MEVKKLKLETKAADFSKVSLSRMRVPERREGEAYERERAMEGEFGRERERLVKAKENFSYIRMHNTYRIKTHCIKVLR